MAKRPLTAAQKQELFTVMPLFSSDARTYSKLSIAALFVPIVFLEHQLGFGGTATMAPTVKWALILSWWAFLLAAGAGLAYRSLAVKYVETLVEREVLHPLVSNLRYCYWGLLAGFFLGALLFAFAATAAFA